MTDVGALETPGPMYLGTVGASSVIIGSERALVVDNTTTPPTVLVNGLPAYVGYLFATALPADNPGPIAVDAPIGFPFTSSAGGVASANGTGSFALTRLTTYEVSYQVTVVGAAQLALWLDAGQVSDAVTAPAKIPRTVSGRAGAATPLSGRFLIKNLSTATRISLRNGASGGAITLASTPGAGSVIASLVIRAAS